MRDTIIRVGQYFLNPAKYYFRRADELSEQGLRREAIQHLEKCVISNPNVYLKFRAFVEMANNYWALSLKEEELESYSKGKRIGIPLLLYFRGKFEVPREQIS